MKMNEIINEGAYEQGLSDGKRGRVDPRASSKYGPQAGDYHAGYFAGEKQAKADNEKKQSAHVKAQEPFQAMSDEDLQARMTEIEARREDIRNQRTYSAEDKAEYSALATEYQMIATQQTIRASTVKETTSAGAVAAVASPMGGMRKRPNPSIFPTSTKKKSTKK